MGQQRHDQAMVSFLSVQLELAQPCRGTSEHVYVSIVSYQVIATSGDGAGTIQDGIDTPIPGSGTQHGSSWSGMVSDMPRHGRATMLLGVKLDYACVWCCCLACSAGTKM